MTSSNQMEFCHLCEKVTGGNLKLHVVSFHTEDGAWPMDEKLSDWLENVLARPNPPMTKPKSSTRFRAREPLSTSFTSRDNTSTSLTKSAMQNRENLQSSLSTVKQPGGVKSQKKGCNASDVKVERKEDREGRTAVCQLCDAIVGPRKFQNHAKVVHYRSPLYRCPICQHGVKKIEVIRQHLMAKHGSADPLEAKNSRIDANFQELRELQMSCFPGSRCYSRIELWQKIGVQEREWSEENSANKKAVTRRRKFKSAVSKTPEAEDNFKVVLKLDRPTENAATPFDEDSTEPMVSNNIAERSTTFSTKQNPSRKLAKMEPSTRRPRRQPVITPTKETIYTTDIDNSPENDSDENHGPVEQPLERLLFRVKEEVMEEQQCAPGGTERTKDDANKMVSDQVIKLEPVDIEEPYTAPKTATFKPRMGVPLRRKQIGQSSVMRNKKTKKSTVDRPPRVSSVKTEVTERVAKRTRKRVFKEDGRSSRVPTCSSTQRALKVTQCELCRKTVGVTVRIAHALQKHYINALYRCGSCDEYSSKRKDHVVRHNLLVHNFSLAKCRAQTLPILENIEEFKRLQIMCYPSFKLYLKS